MRDFYGKYFKINDNERISDKKMLINVITTVTMVVVCLAMMSMVAFSYFKDSISTGESTITSSNFNVKVSAQYQETQDVVTVPVHKVNTYITGVNFSKSDCIYEVTLTMEGDVNKGTGYCSILIGDRTGTGKTLETVQFGKGIKEGNETDDRVFITFYVVISNSITDIVQKPITLQIIPTWGTSANTSECKITGNSTVTINSRGTSPSSWDVELS